jgi:hypothetical protein
MEQGKTKGNSWLSRLGSATTDQAKDTGMAMVLICLLLAYWGRRPGFVPVAIGVLLVTMAWPQVLRPLAVFWFGLSHLMGNLVSKVILTILFFLLVTPIGLIRRWAGADSLQLKKWKQGRGSVFKVREGEVLPQDLTNPY